MAKRKTTRKTQPRKRKGKGHGSTAPGKSEYSEDHDPGWILEWFESRLQELEDVVKVVTQGGDVKWVGKPVRMPTFAEYARDRGVCSQALLQWRDKHEAFGEAYAQCKDIQEIFAIDQGCKGTWPASFAALVARHYAGVRDKVEVEHTGTVTQLVYDRDDIEAVEGPQDDDDEAV